MITKQVDQPLFTLRGSKIPQLNQFFQETFLTPNNARTSLNTSQNHFLKFFHSSRGTGREFFHIEPFKIEKIQQIKQQGDRSQSVIKTKFIDDSKIKGLLNLIQDRNNKPTTLDSPKLNSSPCRNPNFNITPSNCKKLRLNFKRINMKFPIKADEIDSSKRFLIHTLRKNSTYQNQPDTSRPVRSKSDVERVRSKSNLKLYGLPNNFDSQKKKFVRFSEKVEIRMFEQIKSHIIQQ